MPKRTDIHKIHIIGGQTPLNLDAPHHLSGVPIMGTRPENIGRAEDRRLFQELLQLLGLNQPVNDTALTIQYETMRAFCPADARLFR